MEEGYKSKLGKLNNRLQELDENVRELEDVKQGPAGEGEAPSERIEHMEALLLEQREMEARLQVGSTTN